MLVPELPQYLTELGGAEYKGLIISLFTVTAMLSRPFSGKLSDKMGRLPVMIFGAAVCLVCSLIYPVLTSIYGFFLLRLAHGFSTGFTPTGQAAYLSDVIPANRRGEAMGYLGTASTLGMASGPAIGGLVANQFGINVVFYLSSLFALISILILINSHETLKEKKKFSVSMLNVSVKDIWEPRVWMPCFVMLLTAYSYGALFTLAPDFGEHVGIKNKGILFTYFTVASLLVRLIGGKASDYYGRIPVLRLSTVFVLLSMATMAIAEDQFTLICGVVFYGVAQGITSPTLLAWATDLSDEQHRGRGIACFYIFMEMGIGLGAFVSGWIYGNDPAQFLLSFMVCSVLAFLSFAFLVTRPLFSYYEAR
jgi:MFS family permease